MAVDLATAPNSGPPVNHEASEGGAGPSPGFGADRQRAAMHARLAGHEAVDDQLATLKPAAAEPPSARPLSQRGPYGGPSSHGQHNGTSKPNFTSRRRQSGLHPPLNDLSRFSFNPDIDLGTFLEPTFNFDEFHDRISVTNPDLSSFPLPRGASFRVPDRPDSPSRRAQRQARPATQAVTATPSRRTGGPAVNTATAPRKSIGPGTFVAPEQEKMDTLKRRPSVGGGRKSSTENRTVPALKSQASNDPLAPARTPDPAQALAASQSSATLKRTSTPGTVNRRMSAMPSHVSGLGARTISPTDARRIKRMSMVPPAPPLPHTRISQAPPSPQPDPLPALAHATVHSPAAAAANANSNANAKSMTPSSSRTTPDHHRKSYSSGQSLSSATSLNSVRTPGAAAAAAASGRLSQAINSSRLPTPKPKLDLSTSPQSHPDGEVPPVPAIPKAYESPGSEPDQPYFSARSSSLPPTDTPISASPPVITFGDAMAAPPKQKTQPRPIKKNDKPALRLPPLNLLPLSTPTSAKIKAFMDTRVGAQDGAETPMGARNATKTPSTPMTASKAGFSIRNQRLGDDGFLRSSTSHYVIRPDSLQGTNSPGLPIFAFDNELPTTQNRTISPFSAVTESPTERASDSESAFSVPALRRKLSRKRSETKASDPAPPVDASKYDNMPPPRLPASATWSGNLSSAAGAPASQKPPPTYVRSRRQTSASSTKPPPKRQESADSSVTHLSGRPSIDSTRSLGLHSNRSESLLASPSPLTKPPAGSRGAEATLDKADLAAEDEMKKLAAKRRGAESEARELDALRARACPARRVSAATALHVHNLNIFERGEIVDFQDVYFVGTKAARKIVGDNNLASTNFGYDDDRGDYNIVLGDHLAYRYEVVDLLGKGSFGQVVRCIDHKTGELVAVKIIRNKKRFHQQALVEVNILKKLKEWDPDKVHSVVNFDQSFYFRGHLCISTDLLGMNLYEFIKAHDFRGFSLKLIRRFTKQILASLTLLQRHNVIHCDLKPENILLAHPVHSEIKVIDFGSSCFETEKVYTYIQSRFYRSPEVILGMSYGMPIDMWSVGCILAELYTGYPIFPGENEQEQLACIMEVFGPPEKRLIEKSSRKKLFFDSMGKPRLTVSSKGRRRRPSSKELRQVLKCEDEAFLDFITRCLRWDPARRMTPHEASRHEFITGVKVAPPQPRPRGVPSSVNSPVKRLNSVNGSIPPSSTLRVNTARQDAIAVSPSKGASRRASNVNNNSLGVAPVTKRASHLAVMSSSASNPNLTKTGLQPRTMNARSDLATAAAAASLVK
ncbi:hypothetical protein DV737_g5640, partial [Chaetothyriales sp. CBS 132003]